MRHDKPRKKLGNSIAYARTRLTDTGVSWLANHRLVGWLGHIPPSEAEANHDRRIDALVLEGQELNQQRASAVSVAVRAYTVPKLPAKAGVGGFITQRSGSIKYL